MDASSVMISAPDSSEGGRSSDRKANTIPSFECPSTFKRVEISTEGEPLYLEDIEEDAELWFIKTPHNFDAKRLSTKNVSLSGRQFLDENEESDVSYELLASQTTLSDKGLPHLLLPSRHGTNLVLAPAFQGQLSVMETVAVPAVLLPPSPPKRSHELPPGLKQRFLPFGWEEPKKQPIKTKSADAMDGSISQMKPKKKKSRKDKKAKELTLVTSEDANLQVGQSDTKSDDRRLPGAGEAEVGDEDGGGVTKEHKKSKKRKHRNVQKDAENRSQVNSKETPQKKKKKKHEGM